MGSESSRKALTVSTKLPAGLVARLDRIAENRCSTRSHVLRELVEAAVEGRVHWRPPVRRQRLTVADVGASEVAAAARKAAQRDAAAACRGVVGAQDVDVSAQDLEEVVRRAARLLAEGA